MSVVRRGRFTRKITAKISPDRSDGDDVWDVIQLARHQDRPYPLDYVQRLMTDFEEIHGDRLLSDDPALVCGVGRYHGRPVAVIGHQKGRDTNERTFRNFGMPSPEGYRKGMRLMELAAKFDLDLITLIDTPGAYPGAGAEERGQGGAIARSMQAMLRLPVPTVAVVIGEGSSGGALALGVADRVVMLENTTYSVISPEGGSAILWRDAGRARDAAAAFRPTAANCYRWGVADAVVPEPPGGAHEDADEAARLLDTYLDRTLSELRRLTDAERRTRRRERFRRMGVYREVPPEGGAAIASGRAGRSASSPNDHPAQGKRDPSS